MTRKTAASRVRTPITAQPAGSIPVAAADAGEELTVSATWRGGVVAFATLTLLK
jgi:hypothetical protein